MNDQNVLSILRFSDSQCSDWFRTLALVILLTCAGFERLQSSRAADVVVRVGEVQGHVGGDAFSADGERLGTRIGGESFQIWNTQTLAGLAHFTHPGKMSGPLVSADGASVFSASVGEVWRWDVSAGKVAAVSQIGKNCQPELIALTGDGKLLATVRHAGDERDDVVVYKFGSPEPAQVFEHATWVWQIQFDPSRRYLLTLSSDRKHSYRVWNLETGRETISPISYDPNSNFECDIVSGAAFAPSGVGLLLPRQDGFEIVDYTTGAIMTKAELGEHLQTERISFSPDGTRVAVICGDPALQLAPAHVFDSKTGRLIARIGKSSITCQFLKDPNFVLCATERGPNKPAPEIWNASSQARVQTLSLNDGEYCNGVNVSPDGSVIAEESNKGTTVIWRIHKSHPQGKNGR